MPAAAKSKQEYKKPCLILRPLFILVCKDGGTKNTDKIQKTADICADHKKMDSEQHRADKLI